MATRAGDEEHRPRFAAFSTAWQNARQTPTHAVQHAATRRCPVCTADTFIANCAGPLAMMCRRHTSGTPWVDGKVVCQTCCDRTTCQDLVGPQCGGGCDKPPPGAGAARHPLTADGSRGCDTCAGHMPVHMVWLAQEMIMLNLALEWLSFADNPAKPINVGQRLLRCIDMAQGWQTAASIGLNQGRIPEIAFHGKPIPWSS